MLWGIRSRNYSSDQTAQLVYEAEALTPISPAASATNTSASGGTEISISALGSNWTPVLSTDLANVGPLTHTGSYRVWARVRTTATVTAPKVRLVWDVGDFTGGSENDAAQLPLASGFWLADLGEVRLDPAPVGAHRWRGTISAAGGDGAFAIDRIWFQPIDEYAGRLSASSAVGVGISGYSARDEFDQTSGNLTGKTLPLGGTWTYASGDTDDFTMDTTNHWVQRTTTSDTAERLLYANGPTLTDTVVQIDFKLSTPAGGAREAFVLFRYVDANNYGFAKVAYSGSGPYLLIGYKLAGSLNTLASPNVPEYSNAWWTLRAQATADGKLYAWLYPQGSTPPSTPTASRTDGSGPFSTSETLASGKVGFGDYNSGGAVTRLYDNFSAWAPDAADALLVANLDAQLRTDGMYRKTAETYYQDFYGPVSRVIGDLPRIPPAGMENRTTEIFLKPSVGDLDQSADTAISRIWARVYYSPCYLFVPEA